MLHADVAGRALSFRANELLCDSLNTFAQGLIFHKVHFAQRTSLSHKMYNDNRCLNGAAIVTQRV
jgi:hypothetical protein